MDVSKLICEYLEDAKMMQLATLSGNQPWISTVYYVADYDLNIYWLSKPDRKHSKDVEKHKKVAAAIPIKFTPGKPAVGLQVAGEASEVKEADEIAKAIAIYTSKYSRGREFYNNFLAGKNDHKLYRIEPSHFVLFDEVNFPRNPKQEWQPNS